MKIRFLKSTVADREYRAAGEVAEVSDKNARFLIGIGKAEPAPDEPEPEPAKKKTSTKKD